MIYDIVLRLITRIVLKRSLTLKNDSFQKISPQRVQSSLLSLFGELYTKKKKKGSCATFFENHTCVN